MKYIKLDTNKWVEVDEERNSSRIIVKSEIEQQLSSLTEQLTGKELVTDEQLLEWAKINYPNSQEVKDIRYMEQQKIVLEGVLINLK